MPNLYFYNTLFEGFQVDPKKSPQYFHSIEYGEYCKDG